MANTAREMVEHARKLIAEAATDVVAAPERDKLREEADQWLDKAKEIAESADRLASRGR